MSILAILRYSKNSLDFILRIYFARLSFPELPCSFSNRTHEDKWVFKVINKQKKNLKESAITNLYV